MSKAEIRKIQKPLMEKRRRARINQSLNEIKGLVLEGLNEDPSRESKLEKADILEMAVKYLQNLHRQQLISAMSVDPDVLHKFRNGFKDCIEEVNNCMKQVDSVDQNLRYRIRVHLHKCIKDIETMVENKVLRRSCGAIFKNGDQNNNSTRIYSFRLFPQRVLSEELDLFLSKPDNVELTKSSSPVRNLLIPEPSSSAPTCSSKFKPSSESLFKPLPAKVPVKQSNDEKTTTATEDRPTWQYVEKSNGVLFYTRSNTFALKRETDSNTFFEKGYSDKQKDLANWKNIAEPLSVITNHDERNKQAQKKEDSFYLQENAFEKTSINFSDKFSSTSRTGQFFWQKESRSIEDSDQAETVSGHAFGFYRSANKLFVPPDQEGIQNNGGEEDDNSPTDIWRPW